MSELLDVFAIKDALSRFSYLDLYNASLALLQAMNYPANSHSDCADQKIENFIYFTVQNKSHYSTQEMMYLKHIITASFLCELRHCDLFSSGSQSSEDTIVFLAIETNSSEKDRSEDSFYIAQILSKTYNGHVILIIKNENNIMLCTFIDEYGVFMSDWYRIDSAATELFPLCAICYPYLSGVRTVKDYYYEIAFGFSRDYIRYPESYEYAAYQYIQNVEIQAVDGFISRQQIREIAEKNLNFYKEKYGYDYVTPDFSFKTLSEEDDEWTLLELDDSIFSDTEDLEDADESDFEGDVFFEEVDFSGIDDETLNDPVKLLKWLEQRD